MLGATHTLALIELIRQAGIDRSLTDMPDGASLVFGNLMPDTLPVVGVSPLVSHDWDRAVALEKAAPPLGTGVKVHLYIDNLTHCDNVEHDGNYGASVAFHLGEKLMKGTGGRFRELVEKFSHRSAAYTLHTVIELAADVIAARDEVIEIIEESWQDSGERHLDSIGHVGRIYEIETDKLRAGMKKFPPRKRPSPEALYSRHARAELFLRKFAPRDYDFDSRDEDRARVVDLIRAGEALMIDRLDDLMRDFASRILESDTGIENRLREIAGI